jgi:hypothetical protein
MLVRFQRAIPWHCYSASLGMLAADHPDRVSAKTVVFQMRPLNVRLPTRSALTVMPIASQSLIAARFSEMVSA